MNLPDTEQNSVTPSLNGEAPLMSHSAELGMHHEGGDGAEMTEDELRTYQEWLSSIPPDEPPPPEDKSLPVAPWEERLLMAGTGRNRYVEQKSLHNIYLMTRYSDTLRGMFILDEFSQRKHIVKCPPWETCDRFKPREVRDDDITRVIMELETLRMKPTREKVTAAVESICHDRSYHPARKFFDTLKWDGKKRLDKMLSYYFGCESEPAEYLAGIATKWMIAGVARIYKPGCKFDHMLILEGSTDIGKSKALRMLATFNGTEYFYDGMTFNMLYDKDTMLKLQGNIIIEFPELSSLTSRDVEEVKQWITIQEDRGRKPYGKELTRYPRQFILAGSCNKYQYLRDETGNKRYWPAKCGEVIDFEALERDRMQLWAEAVVLYKAGEPWWIPEGDRLIGLSKSEQSRRMITGVWHDDVMEFVDTRFDVTIREILDLKIKIPLERRKRSDEMEVARILTMNGWEQGGRDSQGRKWRRKNTQKNSA